jgi:hypothetical protein
MYMEQVRFNVHKDIEVVVTLDGESLLVQTPGLTKEAETFTARRAPRVPTIGQPATRKTVTQVATDVCDFLRGELACGLLYQKPGEWKWSHKGDWCIHFHLAPIGILSYEGNMSRWGAAYLLGDERQIVAWWCGQDEWVLVDEMGELRPYMFNNLVGGDRTTSVLDFITTEKRKHFSQLTRMRHDRRF